MYDHLRKISGFTFLERTHADPIINQNGIVTGARLTDKDGNAQDISAHYVVAEMCIRDRLKLWLSFTI